MLKRILTIESALIAVALNSGGVLADEPDGGVVEAPDSGAAPTDPSIDAPEKSDRDDNWENDGDWGETNSVASSDPLSKIGVRIHGVFENQLQAMWLRGDDNGADLMVNDYTKLRVDLDADLAGGMALRTDGVVRIFVGETKMALKNLIPRQTREALLGDDPRWAAMLDEPYQYDNDYYLDNAYLKVPVGPLTFFIGKQPLVQGVGYAWNPTDVFTTKDMFDPTYEKPGIIALRAKMALGERVTLDVMGAPKDAFKNWIGGGRASVIAGPLRLSAASYVTRIEARNLMGSMEAMMAAAMAGENPDDAVITYRGRRVLMGGEAVLDIEGVRLWAEGAYNFVEEKRGLPDDYLEIVAGVEYYFETETHVMAEYLHYGMGPVEQEGFYGFNDWMGILSNDYKMLGRDFLFESIDHPVADFWTIGLSSFQSLSDASAAIMSDARWQFREDAELWILLSYAVGAPDDFFSSANGQAWLRLTAYF